MWARAAAAILCIGVGAGLANVNINYGESGLTIRTGWLSPAAAAVASPQSSVASQESPVVSPAAAPWRDDLATLENQLRTEFRSAGAPASPSTALGASQVALSRSGVTSMSDAEMLRRMRALVDESERKQERELALRVGQVLRDVNAQRQSDLRKIDSNLGVLQNNTGAEIMRQRQVQMNLMNYIVRTSDKK